MNLAINAQKSVLLIKQQIEAPMGVKANSSLI